MNMSKELKKDWLPKLHGRYARRTREGKSRMLDGLCEDYRYEQPQRGRELRLKARPFARFIAPSNAARHITTKKPKHGSQPTGFTQNFPVSLSMSQREWTAPDTSQWRGFLCE